MIKIEFNIFVFNSSLIVKKCNEKKDRKNNNLNIENGKMWNKSFQIKYLEFYDLNLILRKQCLNYTKTTCNCYMLIK